MQENVRQRLTQDWANNGSGETFLLGDRRVGFCWDKIQLQFQPLLFSDRLVQTLDATSTVCCSSKGISVEIFRTLTAGTIFCGNGVGSSHRWVFVKKKQNKTKKITCTSLCKTATFSEWLSWRNIRNKLGNTKKLAQCISQSIHCCLHFQLQSKSSFKEALILF